MSKLTFKTSDNNQFTGFSAYDILKDLVAYASTLNYASA